MRTTVDIPDAIYRRLKARAAAEGKPAKSLILEGVALVLGGSASVSRRRVTLPLVPSRRPGSMHMDNAAIYDVISFP